MITQRESYFFEKSHFEKIVLAISVIATAYLESPNLFPQDTDHRVHRLTAVATPTSSAHKAATALYSVIFDHVFDMFTIKFGIFCKKLSIKC